jgi:hypothetical protein
LNVGGELTTNKLVMNLAEICFVVPERTEPTWRLAFIFILVFFVFFVLFVLFVFFILILVLFVFFVLLLVAWTAIVAVGTVTTLTITGPVSAVVAFPVVGESALVGADLTASLILILLFVFVFLFVLVFLFVFFVLNCRCWSRLFARTFAVTSWEPGTRRTFLTTKAVVVPLSTINVLSARGT